MNFWYPVPLSCPGLVIKMTSNDPAANAGSDFYEGLFFAVLAVAAFNLMWLDNYFPVCEGWFSAYAHRWIGGYLPYKDTGLFLPPLYTWQLSLWERVFGPSFLGLRCLGLAAVSGLAAVVYLMLRRLTSSFGASIAAALSVLCFESFNVFIPYDYHTFDTIYAALSVLFMMKAFESRKAGRVAGPELPQFALSGFFAACCLLVKHSMGVLLVFTVFLVFSAGCWREKARDSLTRLLFLSLGAALPMAVFLVWLYAYSSPAGFYKCVVLGVGAKGSLASTLFGFLRIQFTRKFALQLAIAAGLVYYLQKTRTSGADTPMRGAGWLVLACSGIIVLWHHFVPFMHFARPLSAIYLTTLPFAVPLSVVASLFALFKARPRGGQPMDGASFSLFSAAALSCCFMYSTAMSTQISAPGAFLGVGVAVSLVWNKLAGVKRAAPVFLAVLFLCADGMVAIKYHCPYYWWNVTTPDIRSALVKFELPLLKGISTSPGNKAAIEGAVRIILDNTKPSDPIFAYPSIPLFYLLTDRWPPTYYLQHWYDTVTDEGVRDDLARLKADPPKAAVLLELPDAAAEVHEQLFRGGRLSAQREMAGWLNAQTHSGIYKIAADLDLGYGAKLRVIERS